MSSFNWHQEVANLKDALANRDLEIDRLDHENDERRCHEEVRPPLSDVVTTNVVRYLYILYRHTHLSFKPQALEAENAAQIRAARSKRKVTDTILRDLASHIDGHKALRHEYDELAAHARCRAKEYEAA